MQQRHQLLMVEGSMRDAFLIVTELEQAGLEVEFERVETAAYLAMALDAKEWDFIICDAQLPDFDWVAALAIYQQKGLDIPFILVSGMSDEDRAMERIKTGIHEYVLKDNLARLPLAVKRELRSAQERRIRRQSEAHQLVSRVESSVDATIGTTLDGTIISWNGSAECLFGYPAAEMVGRSAAVLMPVYRQEDLAGLLQEIGEGGPGQSSEAAWLRKDGTPVEVFLTICAVKDTTQRVIGAAIVVHDITLRKLEENDPLALIHELTTALEQTGPLKPLRRND
jgi:PAS domain S-box-containing protein